MGTATRWLDAEMSVIEQVGMRLPATFVWGCDNRSSDRPKLYEEASRARWDAEADLDWSVEIDPGALPGTEGSGYLDPRGFASPLTDALGNDPETFREIVLQHHGWLVSQVFHSEQGALVAAAEVCAAAESIDDKLTAAALVADEARHVEVYRRYLAKIGISYPVSPPLYELLSQVLNHRYLDMASLGTQVLVEGVAGAASRMGGALLANPLIRRVTALVGEDEAGHAAHVVASLENLYREMSAQERREREDFVLEACRLLSDQLQPVQVWERFGIDAAAAEARFIDSCDALLYRSAVFSRVVPNLGKLGLLTPRVRRSLEGMGILPHERRVDLRSDPGPAAEPDVSFPSPTPAYRDGEDDAFLALRGLLGTVEQIAPEPVLCVLAGLVGSEALAEVTPARIRLDVSGFDDGDWLVEVGPTDLSYRRATIGDEADVQVLMDANLWTELVAGRVSVAAALDDQRVTVIGDVAKARALDVIF